MAEFILKNNGDFVPSYFPITLLKEEIHRVIDQNNCSCFGRLIEDRRGTLANPPTTSSDTKNEIYFVEY